MLIEKVRFKNFNGFGDEYVEIDFTDISGLMLLFGNNGAGKSSISDVITFALYGKVSGKKIGNLVNRYNQNLETETTLIAKNKKVRIIRNLEPDLFELYENGKPIDLAHKSSKQAHLEGLLGIGFHVFNNIISLSISDFKSFTKRLSVKDKRNIIDKIFGIEFITKMHLLNKEKITEKRNDINLINKSISELNILLSETNVKLKEKIAQIKEKQTKEKANYNSLLLETQTRISTLVTEIEELRNKKQKFTKSISDGNLKYSKLDNEIKNLQKKIKLYENKKCPTCNSSLETGEHKEHLKEYKQNLEFYKQKELEYFDFCKRINEKIDTVKAKISKTDEVINIENNRLLDIKLELSKLQVNNDTSDLQIIIDETVTKINNYKKANNSTNDELQVLRIVNEILSDNGVKRVLFNRIIPSFNREVKNILDKFGLNYKVNIDSKFNTSITYLGKDVPIDTLSTGQLKKIDIAIILTFIKILKTQYSSLNIIFLDEVFSSIDTEGRYGILTILKDLSESFKLNIIVVNHSEIPTELFDYKLEAILKDNFSHLEIEQIE